MNEIELEYFKVLLNSQLQELQTRIDYANIRNMSASEGYHEILEKASADTDKSMLPRIREREGRLICKIKKALQRIVDREYGICEKCGDEIPINRLKARPVTCQCIACKSKEEAYERVSGL